ncbi:MAG: hypothetical protein NC299_12060 [Lachnospiraceae bacterium]|nr:hypothetical protein [Ruminococcus sp.]MCM1276077.1 hypothetical protein [Lachnospiraceae bacterium]
MTITIDNIEFNNVTELNAKRELRRTDIRYNTQGDMLIDMVCRKYALEVTFGLLTESGLKTLRELSERIFVTVKFTAPEGEVTADFHISDEPAPELTVVNGVKMYGGVKLTMKQK